MIAAVPSATLLGVDGRPVTVEVHVSSGLPGFTIVGLADAACRESRDRVRAALLSSGLAWPLKRVTVNLAPSAVRKGGSGLDLPIAVALLVAAEVLPHEAIARRGFLGEVGLDGSLRAVPGVVAMAEAIEADELIVPAASAAEAEVVGRHVVRAAHWLSELVAALVGAAPWPERGDPPAAVDLEPPAPDLADVRGQWLGRWAVEVAAAGGHHLLMSGPPGAGKSLLARRLVGLLPELERAQALEVTRIHSAAGQRLPHGGLVRRPPLRAPHHGASAVALIGGGTSAIRPGEISLAHRGVLFLDELGEFPASVLDALRQPLEEGVVRVARAAATVVLPAAFLLVAAMNPCPCGDGGAPGSCRCSDAARDRYARRVSGPLLDRFDLRVPISRPDVSQLLGGPPGETSGAVAERVAAARQLAAQRGVRCNAEIPGPSLDELAPMTAAARRLLDTKLRTGRLSARGLHRVRRVARTLADLDGSVPLVDDAHVAGALQLRVEGSELEAAAAPGVAS